MLILIAMVLMLGFGVGCTPPDSASRIDAGRLDGGAIEAPDSGAPRGHLSQGEACLVANDLCGRELICSQVFDVPSAVGARCWPRCENAGPCSGVRGEAGDCRTSADGAGICVVTSPNLGACGDTAASICADGQLCIFATDALVGHCVTPCSPSAPSTCGHMLEGIDCGCTSAEDCSIEGLRLGSESEPDGVCIAPTLPGDTCGVDPMTTARTQCSPGQRCEASDGGVGACVVSP